MAASARAESARRVSDCVAALLREQPFFGALALRLPIRPDASRATLAGDGREIRFSPYWVAETGADLVKTAIARVVLAAALKHHTRRAGRDPERWQQASQLVTHGMLRDAGFVLPTDAEAWDRLSVEQAYDRLSAPDGEGADGDAPDALPAGGAATADAATGSDSGGDGDSADESRSPADDRSPDTDAPDADDTPAAAGGESGEDGDSGNESGSPAGSLDAGGGGAGPDAGGPAAGSGSGSDSQTSHDPGGTGEIMDAPAGAGEGGPVPDIAAEEQAWDEAMHQAMQIARAQGRVPGAVEETVRSAHDSVLDWRALLRRYMTDAAGSDYTWTVPNRRFIDSGLYLPSLRAEGMGCVAVIVDTSGSVPGDMLTAFWTEVREIAAELRPETVHVLQVDAALQDAAEHACDDLPGEIALRGRGGTDFRPGFAWLDEHAVRPACCLYFTDMECDSYPELQPDYPVIWCNWGPVPGDRNREPWGERIDIAETV